MKRKPSSQIIFFTKSIILFSLIFFYFSQSSFSKISAESGIPVGTRTSDSTGIISISNASIQSSIVPTIPLFKDWQILSDESTLSVTNQKSYLMCRFKRPSGDIATVAFQLSDNGGSLSFLPGSGSDILYFVPYGNCVDCKFYRAWGKTISGCACGQMPGEEQAPSGCKFAVIKSR